MTTMLRKTVADLPEDLDPGPHHKILPMSEVLAYHSTDGHKHETLWDVLCWKVSDPGYPELKDSIERWGLAEGRGVSFMTTSANGATVCNGHHRLAVLVELGAEWCPKAGYDSWREFVAPDGSRPARQTHGEWKPCGNPECCDEEGFQNYSDSGSYYSS